MSSTPLSAPVPSGVALPPISAPAAGATGAPPSQHGTFKALVKDDTDLVGHVAYALYKRDKLKFCEAEAVRTGSRATGEVIDAFIRSSNIDTRVSAYRAEAEELLEQMTKYVLHDAIEENRREFNDQLAAKLSGAKAVPRVCWEAIIGSLAVAAAWALLLILLYAAKIGPTKAFHDIANIDLKADVAAPASTLPSTPASASSP